MDTCLKSNKLSALFEDDLTCCTQDEIAATVGMAQQTLADRLKVLPDLDKCPKPVKLSADLETLPKRAEKTPHRQAVSGGEEGAGGRQRKPIHRAKSKQFALAKNSRSGSEDIIDMSTDEVVEWLERRQLVDVLEKHFPDYLIEA